MLEVPRRCIILRRYFASVVLIVNVNAHATPNPMARIADSRDIQLGVLVFGLRIEVGGNCHSVCLSCLRWCCPH